MAARYLYIEKIAGLAPMTSSLIVMLMMISAQQKYEQEN